jgi:hypothetical protein
MKHILLILSLLTLTALASTAQPTPGGGGPPPGGGPPVPITGLEILIGGGALIGARYITKKRK